jgi:hypothetical protein
MANTTIKQKCLLVLGAGVGIAVVGAAVVGAVA